MPMGKTIGEITMWKTENYYKLLGGVTFAVQVELFMCKETTPKVAPPPFGK